MFEGLDSLKELDVTGNMIHTIYPGTFSELPTLKTFVLASNELTTLNYDIFIPELFDEDYDPDLLLDIRFNPLQCDYRMCWLQEAEARGLVFLLYRSAMQCADDQQTPWGDVRLDCQR